MSNRQENTFTLSSVLLNGTIAYYQPHTGSLNKTANDRYNLPPCTGEKAFELILASEAANEEAGSNRLHHPSFVHKRLIIKDGFMHAKEQRVITVNYTGNQVGKGEQTPISL